MHISHARFFGRIANPLASIGDHHFKIIFFSPTTANTNSDAGWMSVVGWLSM